MTLITRMFDTAADARAVMDELKQYGFKNVELSDALEPSGATGAVAVRVEAPFGTALAATRILDGHAGRSKVPATPGRGIGSSPSAGASQPAEIHNGPRTLSEMLGIPELIDSNTYFSGFPLLIRPTRRSETN